MLSMRGGKAKAAKMREIGFPNLVKAREALKRKAEGGPSRSARTLNRNDEDPSPNDARRATSAER